MWGNVGPMRKVRSSRQSTQSNFAAVAREALRSPSGFATVVPSDDAATADAPREAAPRASLVPGRALRQLCGAYEGGGAARTDMVFRELAGSPRNSTTSGLSDTEVVDCGPIEPTRLASKGNQGPWVTKVPSKPLSCGKQSSLSPTSPLSPSRRDVHRDNLKSPRSCGTGSTSASSVSSPVSQASPMRHQSSTNGSQVAVAKLRSQNSVRGCQESAQKSHRMAILKGFKRAAAERRRSFTMDFEDEEMQDACSRDDSTHSESSTFAGHTSPADHPGSARASQESAEEAEHDEGSKAKGMEMWRKASNHKSAIPGLEPHALRIAEECRCSAAFAEKLVYQVYRELVETDESTDIAAIHSRAKLRVEGSLAANGVKLLSALQENRVDLAEEVCLEGADLDQREASGSPGFSKTPLIIAVQMRMHSLVEIMCEAMKNNTAGTAASIDSRDEEGYTALSWASLKGFPELCTLLLDYGADASIRNTSGQTAFDVAASDRVKLSLAQQPQSSAGAALRPQPKLGRRLFRRMAPEPLSATATATPPAS